jgi:hypothetical protein
VAAGHAHILVASICVMVERSIPTDRASAHGSSPHRHGNPQAVPEHAWRDRSFVDISAHC